MKRSICSFAVAFFLLSWSFFLEAMEKAQSPLLHGLDQLVCHPSFPLKSFYKKLIVILATEDVNKLLFFLDKDVLQDKHYVRHMIFLKYVIYAMQKEPQRYTESTELERVQAYSGLLSAQSIKSNDKAWLASRKKLDELLLGKEEISSGFDKTLELQLLKLAKALANTISYVNPLPQLAYVRRQEEVGFYWQEEYCSRLLPLNKKVILEGVLDLLCFYRPFGHKDFLMEQLQSNATSESQEFIENMHNLVRKISYEPVVPSPDLYESNTTPLAIAITHCIERMAVEDIKYLIYIFINPYIQPQARRCLLALKFFALITFTEEPRTLNYDEVALKNKLIDLMRYFNRIPLSSEEVTVFMHFLKELQEVLNKESVIKKESALFYQARMISQVEPFKKKLLSSIIEALMSRIAAHQEHNGNDKRKHSTTDTMGTSPKVRRIEERGSDNRHFMVNAFLENLTQVSDQELKLHLIRYLLSQTPIKEQVDALVQASSQEQSTQFSAERAELAERILVLKTRITSLEEHIQALEQERIQQGQERGIEKQRYEEIYASYETTLEELRAERDTYKKELATLRNEGSSVSTSSQTIQWI